MHSIRRIKCFVIRIFRKILGGIFKRFKVLPIILLFVSFMIVLGLIGCFIWDSNLVSENVLVIGGFKISLDILDVLLGNISLFAAAIAIIIEIKKPKMKIYFINEHRELLNPKKGEVPVGIDKAENIGYQTCIPSSWRMYLVNSGRCAAENIKIKMSIDGVLFDNALINEGYDLERFWYGCGVFETISFETSELVRQGERIEIPPIPFEYSCLEDKRIKCKGYTYLRILIYCNNREAVNLKYKLKIEPYDSVGGYDYEEKRFAIDNEKKEIETFESSYVNWYRVTYNAIDIDKYNYYKVIDPYIAEKYQEVDICKAIYNYYLERDVDKMIFWARVYYKAFDLDGAHIEDIIQTNLMKQQIIPNKKQQGKYYL